MNTLCSLIYPFIVLVYDVFLINIQPNDVIVTFVFNAKERFLDQSGANFFINFNQIFSDKLFKSTFNFWQHKLRISEVFGLTWDNIDLNNGIIKIVNNVYDKPKDTKGRWFLGTTKTQTGTRQVHISKTLLRALQNYKNKQDYLKNIYGNDYINYHIEYIKNVAGKVIERRIVQNDPNEKYENILELVFTKEDGTYNGTDITRSPYNIIHNELGIKKCRFYDLRGSYATKILNNGVELRDVADILGHKNVETTENFYISSTSDSRKYATEVFDSIIKSDIINEIIKYEI